MADIKILVVDDSVTDLFYLTEILEKAGYIVSTASSGEDCLVQVDASPPHLIVMDVIMPGLNGFQTTRKLTRNPETSHIPIIMCTGKQQATDQVWALRQGAKGCVMKPVNADELLSKIKALI